MWPRRPQTAPADSFTTRVQQVETDCLRRLEFVEAHLDRALRQNKPWHAHMTVVDADIMPPGHATRVLNTLGDVTLWPWWVYLVVGGAALLLIVIIVAALAAVL
jgi:hypothetical protein